MSLMSGGSETVEPGVGVVPWGSEGWALVLPTGSSTKALYEAMATMPGGLTFARTYGGSGDDLDVVLVYESDGKSPSRRQVPGVFLRAMLEFDPANVGADEGRRWMTDGERQAYEAGKADLVDALRRQVIGRMAIDTREITASPE